MNVPDAGVVIDLIEAFRRSKTMFTAVSLGIFDLLPAGLPALAGHTGRIRKRSNACSTAAWPWDSCANTRAPT